LTAYNGRELSRHQKIAKALNAKFYLAHPFVSWVCGLNENTNGLIRQYFPKKHDFKTITQQQIKRVMDKLNSRPDNVLALKHPIRYFSGLKPTLHYQLEFAKDKKSV